MFQGPSRLTCSVEARQHFRELRNINSHDTRPHTLPQNGTSKDADMSSYSRITLFALAVALGACDTPTEPADISATHGKMLFVQKCAACHGKDGTGAGLESLGLGAPPPDLTTLSQQNRGIFPRDYVMSVIDGFNRRDHPSSVMPEFGLDDLGPTVIVEDGGAVTPTPSDLLALAAYIETIQQ